MSRRPQRRLTAAGNRRIRRRRTGRGALLVVTLMLAGSGVLRLAGGTGHVLAEELDGLMDAHRPPAASVLPPRDGGFVPPDIAGVIAALDQREMRVKEREAALADRMAALSLAEKEVRRNLLALEAAEARLKDLMALSETAAEGDLQRLTAVYEAMKPKEAAALFEEMAPEFAAGFLGRMRPDLAAAIMAGLTPETAYTISVMLAGRNAKAPTQ